MNELDEIMSDNGGAVSEPQQEQTQQQPRDESGRFASQAPAEQPAAEMQEPVAEQPTQEHKPNGVPVKAIQEEREKRQVAQAEAEALRREIAELRGMVQAHRQPTPQQPQQEQQPASIFEDPDAFLKAQFESQLSPVQKQMLEMKEFVSENMAVQQHGAETVEAAKKALEEAARTAEGQQMVQKLMQSRHPFGDLVQWHKQQTALARVGNDPDAWLQQEIERRLNDPAEQAKILERIRNGATANTNRTQPVTNLPPSLSRLPAGGNQPADNDMSDGALFSHATR